MQNYRKVEKLWENFARTWICYKFGLKETVEHWYGPTLRLLQIFIQLPATWTKLRRIKSDHHYMLKMSTIG